MRIESRYQQAIEVIKEHYNNKVQNHPLNQHQIESILHEAFKVLYHEKSFSKKNWLKNSIPTATQKQQLINAVTSIVINHENPWKPQFKFEKEIQLLFFDLLRGNKVPAKKILKPQILKAILLKRNKELLNDSKNLIQASLKDIYEVLSQNHLSQEVVFHYEVIIGDFLALLPFLSPNENETFEIPIKIKNKWVLAEYGIEKIQLTKKWMGSPLMAFGLNPKNTTYPPLLLFKGTTYPADHGFALSMLTDGNIGEAVGSYAFKIGKNAIQNWLNKHEINDDNKVLVFGKSLGGALSWMTALHFSNKIGKVMAYGAPGLYPKDSKKLNQLLQDKQTVPEINMFWQKNDTVPYVDKAPHKGINYFQIISGRNRKGVTAHADMFSLHEKSTIIKLDISKHGEKWLRIKHTVIRAVASVLLFPFVFSLYAIYNFSMQTIRFGKKTFIYKK